MQKCDNHKKCIDDAMSKAEFICQDKGLRFTEIRKLGIFGERMYHISFGIEQYLVLKPRVPVLVFDSGGLGD